ncbi:MAG TPA: hypothetical protein VJG49_00125 [Candidatus Nanoarchaeia archaeon]|nr:hypothetical protein [Candidatus Nanoarchaeia archaeon]
MAVKDKLWDGIDIGEGEHLITMWTPKKTSQCLYSALFYNQDTQGLNRKFSLDSTPIVKGSNRDIDLDRSVELSALGHTNVERLLNYFVDLAKIYFNFFGIPEQELRDRISQNQYRVNPYQESKRRNLAPKYLLKEDYIDQALLHQDLVASGNAIDRVSYLKRIKVKGKEVLFPANLRRR